MGSNVAAADGIVAAVDTGVVVVVVVDTAAAVAVLCVAKSLSAPSCLWTLHYVPHLSPPDLVLVATAPPQHPDSCSTSHLRLPAPAIVKDRYYNYIQNFAHGHC